jgi:predicted nuclease with TOPRIM domain
MKTQSFGGAIDEAKDYFSELEKENEELTERVDELEDDNADLRNKLEEYEEQKDCRD